MALRTRGVLFATRFKSLFAFDDLVDFSTMNGYISGSVNSQFDLVSIDGSYYYFNIVTDHN